MAKSEQGMKAEMGREIEIPGVSPLPALPPLTWSGPTTGGNNMADSTGGIMELLQQVAQAVQGGYNQIAGNANQQAVLENKNAEALQEIIPTKIALDQATSEAAMAAQDAGIKARDLLENNPQDPNSLMAMLTQSFVENTKQAMAQREQVAAKKQVGLFDDPLQFLFNAVTLPDEENALNATQAKADMAKQAITQMQEMTTASAQAQKSTARVLTEQAIKAQAQITQAELASKVRDIDIRALGYDTTAIQAMNAGNSFVLEKRIQMLSEQRAAVHETIALAAEKRAEENHEFFIKAHKDDEDAQERVAQLASLGAALTDNKEMTYDEIKYRWKNKDPFYMRKIAELMKIGDSHVVARGMGVSSPAIAATPGQSAVTYDIVGGLPSKQYDNVKNWLGGIKQEVDAEIRAADPKLKVGSVEYNRKLAEAIDKRVSGYVNEKGRIVEGAWKTQAQNVETEGNIFKAPPLDILAQIPAVKNSVLYEKVIAPAVASGVTSSDVQTLIAQAKTAGVKNEEIALGLKQVYDAADAAIYSSTLSKFAIPAPATHIAKVPSAYAIFGGQFDYINFRNPASILDYLNTAEHSARLNKKTNDQLGTGSWLGR